MAKILAIIPARGGSKSIPKKNIRLLAGKPLISYTIEEAKKSKYINRIIVSTDDEEIAGVARQLGAEAPFLRPKKLAEDTARDLLVFKHALTWLEENEGYRPEIIVHLRPTAPLRRVEHIDKGIEMLLNSDADSVRSVCLSPKHPNKMWRIKRGNLIPFLPKARVKESYNLPRQRLPLVYIQNGSVDVTRRSTIFEKNSMTGDRIKAFVMEENESVNINTLIDFELAEILIQKRNKRTR